MERWCGDQSFRTLLDEDPRSAVATYNLDVDPEEVRVLWDSEFAIEHNRRHGNVSAAVQRYRDFNSDKVKWRRQVREECEPSNVRFKEWRRREMTRCLSQFGDLVHDRLIYSPLCIEISDGCSVGCKFCAFSAKPLKSNFKYTKENTAEWRELLKALREIIGPAARWGTCYFATEPLDNPDYEKFCMDFHSVMGMFPQTTTAVPIRNIERTRKLLEIARANGCRVDRFSILTLDTLAKVHEAFSPEELTNVELIVQNPESILNKSIAGRLRTAIVENPDIARQEIKKIMRKNEPVDESRINELPKTISCLSGFLINMVTKTCKLLSPCNADETWPEGYIVHDERTFTNVDSFREVIVQMIEKNMPVSVNEMDTLRFREGLAYGTTDDGFAVTDAFKRILVGNGGMADGIKKIGDYIRAGNMNYGEIALLTFYKYAIPEDTTLTILDSCLKNGVLEYPTPLHA